MRSVITLAKSLTALAALVLLASCAETPSTPTTSGGSSPGSGKIVTATPEETFECNDDLILPDHQPEECRKPEPLEPVVQKPLEPPKPDPIVGTYKVYPKYTKRGEILIFRIYPNNTAIEWRNLQYSWRHEGDLYHFSFSNEVNRGWSHSYSFEVLHQSIKGEPDLIAKRSPENIMTEFEAIKVSDDPDHLFDLFAIGLIRTGLFGCVNEGRKEDIIAASPDDLFDRRFSTLAECEATCPKAIKLLQDYWDENGWQLGEITCPQDRR